MWPLAERQIDDFRRCVRAAEGKLALLGARLPAATPRWWVRRWAHAILLRITDGVETLADARAVYQFARRLDRELSLDASQTARRSCDAEFTFYDRPFERDDGAGGRRPVPFALSGHQRERQGRIAPQPFPRSQAPHRQFRPRLNSHGFLEWAGDLAGDAPLAAGRSAELARVGCSETGVDDWCRTPVDRGECQQFTVHLHQRLQEGIVRVSDRLRLPVVVLPTDQPFTSVLHIVSRWLATAEAASAPPPPELPDFDRDTFSPFGQSGVPSSTVPIPPPVRSLGELRALLADFADLYRSLPRQGVPRLPHLRRAATIPR